jgi:tryptophan synthase beta chain
MYAFFHSVIFYERAGARGTKKLKKSFFMPSVLVKMICLLNKFIINPSLRSERGMVNNKILLRADQMPKAWYNVAADIKEHLSPPLDPSNNQPMDPGKLSALFANSLIEQEVSTQRWIDIPEPILEQYSVFRPTMLVRARQLEEYLQTPARIYYKNEGTSPPGSHKTNTAIPQAYYNKIEGIKRLTTETGAGQWGSALAYACHKFGLEVMVYMVKCSYEQKPFRRTLMNIWGAKVLSSPTMETECGRAVRAQYPDTSGSLGIAISEAVEDALKRPDSHYTLGSVLNHVMLHQTVIGLELKEQLKSINENPDVLIGCTGGGSNFAGMVFPFVPDKLSGKKIRFLAVEPSSCPTLTRGQYAYDFGDMAKLTPLLKMFTLGHDYVPPAIHAGGLRYHGQSPLLSALTKMGVCEATSVKQLAIFEAAKIFILTEGIVPAPESAHAIRTAIDEALEAKRTGEPKVIVFTLSGHGHFDMASYEAYLEGRLEDYEYPEEAIDRAMKNLPKVGYPG